MRYSYDNIAALNTVAVLDSVSSYQQHYTENKTYFRWCALAAQITLPSWGACPRLHLFSFLFFSIHPLKSFHHLVESDFGWFLKQFSSHLTLSRIRPYPSTFGYTLSNFIRFRSIRASAKFTERLRCWTDSSIGFRIMVGG